MGYSLGRFGDRRLEKRGLCCMSGWYLRAAVVFGFADLAGIGRARSG